MEGGLRLGHASYLPVLLRDKSMRKRASIDQEMGKTGDEQTRRKSTSTGPTDGKHNTGAVSKSKSKSR